MDSNLKKNEVNNIYSKTEVKYQTSDKQSKIIPENKITDKKTFKIKSLEKIGSNDYKNNKFIKITENNKKK